MKLSIWQFIIIGLVLLLLFREGCNCYRIQGKDKRISALEKDCEGRLKKDTVKIRDTVKAYTPRVDSVAYPVEKYIVKNNTVYIDTGTTTEKLVYLDTASDVVKSYFSKVYYDDTLLITNGKVIIKDLISENKIQQRVFHTNLNIPVETKIVEAKPKAQLFIGASSGYTIGTNKVFIGPELSLKTKGKFLYKVSYLFNSDRTKTASLGIGYLISFKEKK